MYCGKQGRMSSKLANYFHVRMHKVKVGIHRATTCQFVACNSNEYRVKVP